MKTRRISVVGLVLAMMVFLLAPAAGAADRVSGPVLNFAGLEGIEGESSVKAKSNGTFSWKLNASGLTKGNA